MTLELRQVMPADFPGLLELNHREIPRVTPVDAGDLAWFAENTDWFFVCEEAGRLAGFIIGLPPGLGYKSLNYQWFCSQYSHFLYNDRILASPDFRRRGVARLLYGRLVQEAEKAGLQRICCEVNTRPLNSISLAAHARLGFQEVSRRETEDGSKEMAMLTLTLDASS